MGLFQKTTPEEKTRKVLEQFGLNLDSYTPADIKHQNSESLKRVASDIAGNKYFKAGMALSFAKAHEQATVGYLSAIVEQNWIMLRQNELILQELQKLNSGSR